MANEGAFRGVTDCHVHNDQSPSQNFVGLFKRPNEHEAVPAVLMISETSPSCSIALLCYICRLPPQTHVPLLIMCTRFLFLHY